MYLTYTHDLLNIRDTDISPNSLAECANSQIAPTRRMALIWKESERVVRSSVG